MAELPFKQAVNSENYNKEIRKNGCFNGYQEIRTGKGV